MFSTIVSRVRSRRLSSLDRRRFNPFSNTHSFLDCVLSSEELGRGSRKENKRRKMKEKNIHFATIFSYQFFKITNSVRSKQTKRLVLQLISEGRNSLHAYASIIQKTFTLIIPFAKETCVEMNLLKEIPPCNVISNCLMTAPLPPS